jgi:hypothetical protein
MSRSTPLHETWKMAKPDIEPVQMTAMQSLPVIANVQPVVYQPQPPEQQQAFQTQYATPAPAPDILPEINNMLLQTEEYLMKQMADFHRAGYNHIGKLMSQTPEKKEEPTPWKPFLIALLVAVSLGLVFAVFSFVRLSATLKSFLRIMTPNADLISI